jgi:hypothetical protein
MAGACSPSFNHDIHPDLRLRCRSGLGERKISEYIVKSFKQKRKHQLDLPIVTVGLTTGCGTATPTDGSVGAAGMAGTAGIAVIGAVAL